MSFDNEGNQYAKRPKFNSDPALIFEGGTVPDGWMTATPEEADPTPEPEPTPEPTLSQPRT